jgi:hypothetical protein
MSELKKYLKGSESKSLTHQLFLKVALDPLLSLETIKQIFEKDNHFITGELNGECASHYLVSNTNDFQIINF